MKLPCGALEEEDQEKEPRTFEGKTHTIQTLEIRGDKRGGCQLRECHIQEWLEALLQNTESPEEVTAVGKRMDSSSGPD